MADCPTIVDFRTRFPEFTVDVAPDAMVQAYLDESCSFLNEGRFGEDCFPRAVLYYSAHLISLSIRTTKQAQSSADQISPAQQIGGISGSSAGGLSVSFSGATPKSGSEAWFQLTPYGQYFLHILESCVVGIDIAGSPGCCSGYYRVFV